LGGGAPAQIRRVVHVNGPVREPHAKVVVGRGETNARWVYAGDEGRAANARLAHVVDDDVPCGAKIQQTCTMIREVRFEKKIGTKYPPSAYYWTVTLILDHSYLVGKLRSSKIADTKVSGF
jgi:hypothetical protein